MKDVSDAFGVKSFFANTSEKLRRLSLDAILFENGIDVSSKKNLNVDEANKILNTPENKQLHISLLADFCSTIFVNSFFASLCEKDQKFFLKYEDEIRISIINHLLDGLNNVQKGEFYIVGEKH